MSNCHLTPWTASTPAGNPTRSYDHTGWTLAWWSATGNGACDLEHENRVDAACSRLFGFVSPRRLAELWTTTEVVAKLLHRPALLVWRDMAAGRCGEDDLALEDLRGLTRELGLEVRLHRRGPWTMAFGRRACR